MHNRKSFCVEHCGGPNFGAHHSMDHRHFLALMVMLASSLALIATLESLKYMCTIFQLDRLGEGVTIRQHQA